jgi:hypothetical protein
MNIDFQIVDVGVFSSTFLAVDFVDPFFGALINKNAFYGVAFKDVEQFMDLNGLQLFRKQYINVKKLPGKTSLYLNAYNLDPDSRRQDLNLKINLGTSNALNCFPCNGGTRESPSTSCSCTNCPPGAYGPDCSISMFKMSRGSTLNLPITGPGMQFFQIN